MSTECYLTDLLERKAAISDYLSRIGSKRPVVQCITNIVTVNDCANALLAIGASPTMAHHPQEMEDFAAICDALVCNLGATESLEAMGWAIELAAERRHPVVLDPVGSAGSPFRREQCMALLHKGNITCIRGNAAEIRALALHANTGRGVDDFEDRPSAEWVSLLAAETDTIVIASGETDYVGDGKQVLSVTGGSPMMGRITGSGCMLSALLGAFLSVECSLHSAAICCAMMKDCGEQAQKWTREAARGTGTFHIALLDALSVQ